MSAFHRMVTYLHLYEHNTKGRNTGFAKIAKKGNTCLVEIHMKNTGYSISPIPVYFYAQKEQGFQGILLGNMSLVRGNGDFKAALEERDLSGSGYTLEDIKGIFLPVSDGRGLPPCRYRKIQGKNPMGNKSFPMLPPHLEIAWLLRIPTSPYIRIPWKPAA